MITLISLAVVCIVVVVVVSVVLAIVGIPLMIIAGLLRLAGVVLLVKALLDKPMKWENFMPAIIAFVLSVVLGWIF